MKKIYEILGSILEMNEKELQSFLDYIKKENKKYIICVDMGCGGTSAVYYAIESGFIKVIKWTYMDEKGEKLIRKVGIPTIIGYKDRESVIGPEGLRYGRACENFKKIPRDDNLDKVAVTLLGFFGDEYRVSLRELWTDYFRKVGEQCLQYISEQECKTCSKEDVLFVVAHPASREWKERDILNNYKNMIGKGIGLVPEQIITISEAKAAMQYTRRLKDKKVNWEKGVLIIDLGASTIDIEYLSNKQPDPLEWAITMAGKEVDKLLAYYILSKCYYEFADRFPQIDDYLFEEEFDDDAFEQLTRETRAAFMYRVRKSKETICTYGQMPVKENEKVFNFVAEIPTGERTVSNLVSLEELLQNIEFSFECQDISIAKYLNKGEESQIVKGSWYSHLEGLLSYVLNYLRNKGCGVSDIIVTGGSCQLVGIEKHIREVIKASTIEGKDKMAITMLDDANDYESTVPFGSVYYVGDTIKYLEDIERFPEKLRIALNHELISNRKLAKCITSGVTELVFEEINNAFKEWIEYPFVEASTLQVLKSLIVKKMYSISEENIGRKVKERINLFETNSEKELEKVYAIINEFLMHLSQEMYNYSVNLTGVKIKVDVFALRDAIKKGISSQNFSVGLLAGIIEKCLRFLGWTWVDSDRFYLTKPRREKIRDEFDKRLVVREILELIQSYITDEYKKFCPDLEEQITGRIEDDIKRALYLS